MSFEQPQQRCSHRKEEEKNISRERDTITRGTRMSIELQRSICGSKFLYLCLSLFFLQEELERKRKTLTHLSVTNWMNETNEHQVKPQLTQLTRSDCDTQILLSKSKLHSASIRCVWMCVCVCELLVKVTFGRKKQRASN